MLSIILGIEKDFIFSDAVSPAAKGLYLYLAYSKDISNIVDFGDGVLEKMLNETDGFFSDALKELSEKKLIEMLNNEDNNPVIKVCSNEWVHKFIFSSN